jgi:hypothetical protein
LAEIGVAEVKDAYARELVEGDRSPRVVEFALVALKFVSIYATER